ncbi:hypothetical protein CE91St46_32070 [Eubacteriales bacterium]|nr:hypothetical protein CE91St46_32070 [Eubacteriales bacterium]
MGPAAFPVSKCLKENAKISLPGLALPRMACYDRSRIRICGKPAGGQLYED